MAAKIYRKTARNAASEASAGPGRRKRRSAKRARLVSGTGRPRGGSGENKQREFLPDWKLVGESVASIRRELGHAQAPAARLAGISQSYLSSLEAGERKPTVDSLRKIAIGWGVSVRDLIPKGW